MKIEFTPDEMIFAWGQLGLDRWPAPLALRSSVAWQRQWEEIERDLRLRLPVLQDPDLVPVLRTAADPDMSLIMIGTRKRPLRAYGAVTANIGVTMVQRPGPEPDVGGNVVIEVGSPGLVAKVFAAVAGNQPAGRASGMVETWERLQDNGASAGFVVEQTVASRMRELLAAPRIGYGHIEIRPERRSPRPQPPRYVSWFDVDGDGRYTYTRRYGDFHIDPCSTTGFERLITRLMEVPH
ncbi:ESX secretion-associated protein EspG [Nocardia terpenica]|uniref:ESX secretion-associated protein EspG n=1 Tax=Nocardia terpenica TaxID=455432 RepID=A0A291RE00_9NOCA|nr:ESX secretion-associated protein EspG [Nocardia terpenica]ATL65555.1 hypothetical protein CRH09_04375 [Nocardia terpenica]